jgi:outer membrane assembly lipoprotein YfiO
MPIPEKEQDHFKAAGKLQEAGSSREAFRFYEEFLKSYPASEHGDTALQMAFEIALEHSGTSWGSNKLSKLQERYPAASLAAEALFKVGQYNFENGSYDEAIFAFKSLVSTYPESERIERAVFLTAESELGQYEGPEYEDAPLRRGVEQYKLLLRAFSAGAYVQHARKRLREINREMARRDYLTAQYYQKRGKIVSAKLYLKSILKEYPETEYAAKAQKTLAAITESEK